MKRVTFITEMTTDGEVKHRITETMADDADHKLRAVALNWIVESVEPVAVRGGRYETPAGSFDTWEDAATACEASDFDPCTCIRYISKGPVDVSWETMPDGSKHRFRHAPIRVF